MAQPHLASSLAAFRARRLGLASTMRQGHAPRQPRASGSQGARL